MQHLQAWAELLRLHHATNKVQSNYARFVDAREAFDKTMNRYPWWDRQSREKFKSQKVMEAALELSAAFVKCGFFDQAKRMFQKCHDNASAYFGDHDERTIWLLISIGLVYQKYSGWAVAKQWFASALAAAMLKYDLDDGIVISLEEALEVKHFSYLNDEGRPYKTIFGVGGLKIMPTRLHLE